MFVKEFRRKWFNSHRKVKIEGDFGLFPLYIEYSPKTKENISGLSRITS